MKREKFEKEYNLLGHIEREILQIIALIYEPKIITELKKCIEKLGLFKELKHNERSRIIRDLQNHFIDISGNKLFIKRNIINFIVKDYCLKNPNLNFYRSQISDMYPAAEEKSNFWTSNNLYYSERIIRDFRISFFLDDKKGLEQVLKLNDNSGTRHYRQYNDCNDHYQRYELYLTLFNSSFSVELMHQIPDEYKFDILKDFYNKNFVLPVISYIEENAKNIKDISVKNKIFVMLANYYLNFGNLEKLAQLINNKDIAPEFYAPSIEFLQGNITKAKELYILEIQRILGRSKRKYYPPGIHGVYFVLTMLATNDTENSLLQAAIDKGIKDKCEIYQVIKAYLASKIGEDKYFDRHFSYWDITAYKYPIVCLFLWMINKEFLDEKKLLDLIKSKEYATRINCEYLIYQCHTVLSLTDNKYKISSNEKEKIRKFANKYFDLSTLFKEEEAWIKSLKILKNIVQGIGEKTVIKGQSERLVWFVVKYKSGLEFYPREQTIGKDGNWSKGRPIALKRIMLNKIKSMSSIDKQIATCIKEEQYATYGRYYDTE